MKLPKAYLNIKPDTNDDYIYTVSYNCELLYVGYEKLTKIATLENLFLLPNFKKDLQYVVTIEGPCDNWIEAENGVALKIRENEKTPPLNKTMWSIKTQSVMCRETGKIFLNASECAHLEGISNGNLSRHLKGRPGYKTLKGKTYCYATYFDAHSNKYLNHKNEPVVSRFPGPPLPCDSSNINSLYTPAGENELLILLSKKYRTTQDEQRLNFLKSRATPEELSVIIRTIDAITASNPTTTGLEAPVTQPQPVTAPRPVVVQPPMVLTNPGNSMPYCIPATYMLSDKPAGPLEPLPVQAPTPLEPQTAPKPAGLSRPNLPSMESLGIKTHNPENTD